MKKNRTRKKIEVLLDGEEKKAIPKPSLVYTTESKSPKNKLTTGKEGSSK